MAKFPSEGELIKLAKRLATPVEFEQLEKEGIIEKKGAWYMVKDFDKLPEYASRQINAIKTDGKGNNFVKFPKSWKKSQQLYRKMARKEFNE